MKKTWLRRLIVGGAVCAAVLFAYRTFGWESMAPVNSLKLDLAHPDALVVSRSLADLPRDLLTVPLARDVLREEFVYYYEQNEDRLGLKGSLRRIAYEHQLNWGDELIRMVLDEPAEMALWRDGDGSLKHFAIAISRGNLARLVTEAGTVALKDTQMRRAGTLRVDGDTVHVYALDYAYGRTLLFAAHGSRLVIFSHPGMLYGGPTGNRDDKAAQAIVAKLLANDPQRNQVYHAQFHLPPGIPAGHTVAVKTDFLSFGYGAAFFGALQALRFDFARGRWQSQVLIDGGRLAKGGYDSRELWRALPYRPGGCFTVPADWPAMQPVLRRLGAKGGEGVQALAARFEGPAAACWYPKSRLYTPVFVARQAPRAGTDAALGALFTSTVRGEVTHTVDGDTRRWQTSVETPAGRMTPTLAASGDTVVFSADANLVEQVLAVVHKKAPAAADNLPDPARTLGMIDPAALSQLAQKEAFATLPADSEGVLRAAADAHLVPRLAALAKYPTYRMVTAAPPPPGTAWIPLEWQAIR